MIPQGGLDFPVPACIKEMHNPCHLRRSGGTGRRAGLKIPWPQGREGSTPSSGTTHLSVVWCTTGGGRTGCGGRAAGATKEEGTAMKSALHAIKDVTVSRDDVIKVDPKHYSIEFENDRVRVISE